ncbi:bHLH transcription factor Myc [Musca autumnalis]|uniref:bHLH transcription factor Myc n=1 Tax=Musca autumnalis TaxID=221902 RepID=UPI003CE86CD7
MAKLCSPFGSSPPVFSTFNDLVPNYFTDEFCISADTFDLLDEMPSIYGDIQKMEADLGNSDSYCVGSMDLDDVDIKPEVRNNDLMWSPPVLSTSASSVNSDICKAAPLSDVMGNLQRPLQQHQQQQQQRPQPTVVTAKKITTSVCDMVAHIKQEQDLEQELEPHSIPNIKVQQIQTTTTNMQNIPPGRSLLRKSANHQQQQQQKKLQQNRSTSLLTTSMLQTSKRGDQLLPSANTLNINSSSHTTPSLSSLNISNCSSNSSSSSIYQRPDTPHSLDDDSSAPDFRHNVDLRACIMGSNNISLTSDPTNFINHVSQELQDTSKKQIDTRLISGCSLTEVLDVINSGVSDSTTTTTIKTTSTPTIQQHNGNNSNNSSNISNSSSSMRYSDCDSDDSFTDHEITYGAGGVSPVSSQSSNIGSTHNYIQHSDHSYTRCKDGMDDISTNLETPSDSEEEIDVVSITDKKLPTNPSDKDRRALQTKVAHKFNAARIVKTPNGLRTIPPRRRGSYELPYTPASNSPVKSLNNSRFPSPAATPYQNQYTTTTGSTKYGQTHHISLVMSSDSNNGSAAGVPINILSTAEKSRKRLLNHGGATVAGTTTATIINGELISGTTVLPPSKKHRGKKTKHMVSTIHLQPAAGAGGAVSRSISLDESADTIEKRNLHNDMERQRRIGLKNLFEALKKQIPSIKDKERAPKVNILREAAKLCEALTKEDQQLCELKAKLKDEMRRKQELLNQLREQQLD